jgi:siroheme synthase-like protein
MGYIPIFLDVSGKPCLVVGGGEVAERKVRALLAAGAEVTIVSPGLGEALEAIARRGEVYHLAHRWRRGEMAGFALVYAATGDASLHREIAAEAGELGIPINVADTPELCSFIAPAVIRRGDLQIAISTGGASPALAARLRRELEPRLGLEYVRLLEVMRAARRRLMAGGMESAERARKLRALADSQLRECLAAGDDRAADAILIEHLGATLANLGLARHDDGARIDGTR